VKTIAAEILALPVNGLNLRGPTLGAQFAPGRPHLLAFLRHLG
jgi:hypothetical protein